MTIFVSPGYRRSAAEATHSCASRVLFTAFLFSAPGRGDHSTRTRERRPRVPISPHSLGPRPTRFQPWRRRSPPRSSSRRRSRRSPPPSRTTRRTTRPCRSRPTRRRPPRAKKRCVTRYRPSSQAQSLDAGSLNPARDPGRRASRARAPVLARGCAVPNALTPRAPGSTTTVRAAPAVLPLHRGTPELRHIHDRHQGARLSGRRVPSRARRCASPTFRARARGPTWFFLRARTPRRELFLEKSCVRLAPRRPESVAAGSPHLTHTHASTHPHASSRTFTRHFSPRVALVEEMPRGRVLHGEVLAHGDEEAPYRAEGPFRRQG